MDEIAVRHFQQRAREFLRRKGVRDADLLQEMVCYFLEHQEDTWMSVEIVYHRALDRLDPRHVTRAGRRVRDSSRTLSPTGPAKVLEEFHDKADERIVFLPSGYWQDGYASLEALREAAVSPEALTLPPTGALRAMLLLRLVYGYHEAELGQLFGVTESRISQLLGQGRAEVLAGLRPEREVLFDVPALEVEWITL